MRFQGENCTLSFGLYFDGGQVLLTGTLWPRRPTAFQTQYQSPRLRFQSIFTEEQITNLQRWLSTGSTAPFPLVDPIRAVHRLPTQLNDMTQLELELSLNEVPVWWNWDVSFPLTIQLEVRPNEFLYLTKSLSREYWSADLTW